MMIGWRCTVSSLIILATSITARVDNASINITATHISDFQSMVTEGCKLLFFDHGEVVNEFEMKKCSHLYTREPSIDFFISGSPRLPWRDL